MRGVPGLEMVKQKTAKLAEIETEIATLGASEREKKIAEYEALFKTQKGRGMSR